MKKVFQWSLIVSLAGILFGFDTVVISGADKALQSLWNSSELFHGFVVMTTALWGTVLGAIFGGIPARKGGRKKTLIWIAILYLLSAIGSALAMDPYTFALFRFIGGLGVGASTIAAPAYITEIAPANERGKMVGMYQMSIVLGVLMAMFSNYFLQDLGADAWRWMLGAESLPALLFFVLVFFVPQSPRWLIFKKRKKEASALIKKFNLDMNQDLLDADESSRLEKESIFDSKYRKTLYLTFFIALFNQFSGINAILYYAPRIFESAGLERSNAFLGGVWIGAVNLIFTLIGMFLIDRYGRKQLLYLGSVGYVISLIAVATAFKYEWEGSLVLVFLLMFIASHAIGQGAVIWVFIAEIFPTHLRAYGQAFGSSVHWVLAALIPASIPYLLSSAGASLVFGFFAACMILQLIWVYLKVPETKGQELEKLAKGINNS